MSLGLLFNFCIHGKGFLKCNCNLITCHLLLGQCLMKGLLGVVGCGEGVVYLTSWVVQLILAYIWARPAILVAGKSKGGMFLFLLFLHFHSHSLSSVPLFHLFYYLFYLFSLSLGDDTKWPTRVDMLINPNTTTGKAQISQHMKSDQPICSMSGESLHSFLDIVQPQ